jgi:hypothetical protein
MRALVVAVLLWVAAACGGEKPTGPSGPGPTTPDPPRNAIALAVNDSTSITVPAGESRAFTVRADADSWLRLYFRADSDEGATVARLTVRDPEGSLQDSIVVRTRAENLRLFSTRDFAVTTQTTYSLLVEGSAENGGSGEFTLFPALSQRSGVAIGDTVDFQTLDGDRTPDEFRLSSSISGQGIVLLQRIPSGGLGNVTLRVFAGDQDLLGSVESGSGDASMGLNSTGVIDLNGATFIRVTWEGGTLGSSVPYRFAVVAAGSDTESIAPDISVGSFVAGESLDHIGDVDRFEVPTRSDRFYRLFANFQGFPSRIEFTLEDQAGSDLARLDVLARIRGTAYNHSTELIRGTGDPVVITVTSPNSLGPYEFIAAEYETNEPITLPLEGETDIRATEGQLVTEVVTPEGTIGVWLRSVDGVEPSDVFFFNRSLAGPEISSSGWLLAGAGLRIAPAWGDVGAHRPVRIIVREIQPEWRSIEPGTTRVGTLNPASDEDSWNSNFRRGSRFGTFFVRLGPPSEGGERLVRVRHLIGPDAGLDVRLLVGPGQGAELETGRLPTTGRLVLTDLGDTNPDMRIEYEVGHESDEEPESTAVTIPVGTTIEENIDAFGDVDRFVLESSDQNRTLRVRFDADEPVGEAARIRLESSVSLRDPAGFSVTQVVDTDAPQELTFVLARDNAVSFWIFEPRPDCSGQPCQYAFTYTGAYRLTVEEIN